MQWRCRWAQLLLEVDAFRPAVEFAISDAGGQQKLKTPVLQTMGGGTRVISVDFGGIAETPFQQP